MEDRAVRWACLYSCLRKPYCTEAPCGSLITHRLTSAVAHDLDCSHHGEQTGWPTHATGLLAACLSTLLTLDLCFGRTECPVEKWFKRFLKFSILTVFFFSLKVFVRVCFSCLHVLGSWPEEGLSSLGTRVPDGCGSPCGYWDLNLSLQEEQQCPLVLRHLSSPLSDW